MTTETWIARVERSGWRAWRSRVVRWPRALGHVARNLVVVTRWW